MITFRFIPDYDDLYFAKVPALFEGISQLIDPAATSTAGTDCSGLGFPSGYFHCPHPDYYKKTNGTGWIPVNFNQISSGSPISSLPVDPTNSSSTHLYYSYFPGSSTFKLSSLPESQKYAQSAAQNPKMFQAGSNLALGGGSAWTMVPADSSFGTPNFWVMKYEAKCVATGQTAGLTSPATAYQTYDNATTPCTGANTRGISSVPDGYSIANISHTNAVAYCASIGAHLLTNDEWMTIARNAENTASDWTGGSVGSGALYSGHNDNSPAYALPASADDSDGYNGTGNVSPSGQRRILTLSNGSVVWDLPGNVYEHVARSVMNVGDLTTTMSLPVCSDGLAAWG
ncbi:MAG: SUMF1/EgtB/PvdO family nonheme iron enzyme, partial [Planctomycetota bacterium]